MCFRKNIIYFKLPMNDKGQIAISPELTRKFMELVKHSLGRRWTVIATPFEAQLLKFAQDKALGYDMYQMTNDELYKLLKIERKDVDGYQFPTPQ